MAPGLRILLIVCAILAASAILYTLYGGEHGDYTKVLIINMHIGTNGVTEDYVGLRYGHPPQAGLSSGNFSGRLLSADGRVVREFGIWDPRIQMGDEVVDDGQGGEVLRGATVYSPEADLLLTLPYTGVEELFELHDRTTGTRLTSVNLSAAITSFSQIYPEDPAGPVTHQPDQQDTSIHFVVGCVLVAILIIGVAIMSRRR